MNEFDRATVRVLGYAMGNAFVGVSGETILAMADGEAPNVAQLIEENARLQKALDEIADLLEDSWPQWTPTSRDAPFNRAVFAARIALKAAP